ncbi:MAG: hypothetical protein H7Y02_12885 [Candidatus Obscuribacterales bacterium]|nr:hypothetical protein [Steroidobacteraceae bacterium]
MTLLATLIYQVATQWRDRSNKGVAKWLFIGQLLSSVGFITYSALVGDMIFVVANSLVACVAIFGEYTYHRNRRLKR